MRWVSRVFFIIHSACLCAHCASSGDPRPPPISFCQRPVSQWGRKNTGTGRPSMERMWNLHRICRALALILTVASGQNNRVLDQYGGASCHGAEFTPSDQTSTPPNWAFASLVAWRKNAADMLGSGQPLTVYPLWIALYEALYCLQKHLVYKSVFTVGVMARCRIVRN